MNARMTVPGRDVVKCGLSKYTSDPPKFLKVFENDRMRTVLSLQSLRLERDKFQSQKNNIHTKILSINSKQE